MSNFQIEPEWLSRESGSIEEKATFSALAIKVDDKVASKVEDKFAMTVRPYFRASAYHLAYWFAENWWRLLWECEKEFDPAALLDWAMSHSLSSVGGGYIWPNVSFSSDGSFMSVFSQIGSEEQTPIRFISDFEVHVPIKSFIFGVKNFINKVLERLSQQGLHETQLHQLWSDISKEESNSKASTWRKREALLGLDPDEGANEILELLFQEDESIGAMALDEILATAPENPLEAVKSIKTIVEKFSAPIKIPDYDSICLELKKSLKPSFMPWVNGEIAADIVRKKWQISEGPLCNNTLRDIFSFNVKDHEDTSFMNKAICAAGSRREKDDEIDVFIPYKKYETTQRFSLVRLIGDHLITFDTNDRILPATEAKTSRQKFQRAFAQELLCPFKLLQNYFGDKKPNDSKIEEAACYFNVSPLMIKATLKNKGVLPKYY